jgi:hypothetical protein
MVVVGVIDGVGEGEILVVIVGVTDGVGVTELVMVVVGVIDGVGVTLEVGVGEGVGEFGGGNAPSSDTDSTEVNGAA